MKLLILTQYFPPEVGAPQNRLFELATRLQDNGVEVTVLTAMPNYPQMKIYEGYEGKSYHYEEIGGLKVHRTSIHIPKSKSIIERLKNYFSFVNSSARIGRKKLEIHYDFLLCESPPLFLGYSAMFLARQKKARLIFNVSDLWPESAEKLGVVTNKNLLGMAYRLEAKLYRKSVLVTGQTQGICENINHRFPNVPTYWLPNGVDVSFYNPDSMPSNDWRVRNGFKEEDFIILYAGIIGIAQGLEVLLQASLQLPKESKIKIVLLGSGPEKDRLIGLKHQLQADRIEFLEGVNKNDMPAVLKSVNASVIPLKKLDLFKGAIPSKIFENLVMKLPVILAVDGEARKLFVEQGKCAIYVEPENIDMMAKTMSELENNIDLQKTLGEAGRKYVNDNFNRDSIAKAFYQKLIQIS